MRAGLRAAASRHLPSGLPALSSLAAWSPAIVALGFLIYGHRAGLPMASASRAVLAVLLTQLLPGVLVWRAVRPPRGWWLEDVAMGFALGTVLAVAAQTVAGLTRLPWLSAGIGLAIAAALLCSPVSRARILSASTVPLPPWWAPAVSACSMAAVLPLRDYFRAVPLTWTTGFRAPHNDTYLHLALMAELAHRGPERFPWVASEALGYHWFSHAWMAQVSVVSGAGLDETLTRFTPVIMPVVVALSVATAALRLSVTLWAGPVAALLTMMGGQLNVFHKATPGYPITPFSPSLGLAAPVLIATVVVLAMRWRGEMPGWGRIVLPALTVAAGGLKGSTVPLVVAGLALALGAAMIMDRSS
ncbi:MAG: hypothetical protein QOH80_2101, partial [Actinomycetota bacterium]|nr:hypothetical protein [Actinomycetota bacterium]